MGDVGKGTAASFRGAGSIVTVTEIDQFVLYKLQWTVLKLKN
jgi:adenosylhomocysteinase